MTFEDACRYVLDGCKDPYARSYAHVGLYIAQTKEEKRIQALYLMSNITYWRHPNANRVREFLKIYTNVNEMRANIRMKGK